MINVVFITAELCYKLTKDVKGGSKDALPLQSEFIDYKG